MLSRRAPSDTVLAACALLLASCTTITTFGNSDGSGGEAQTDTEDTTGILPTTSAQESASSDVSSTTLDSSSSGESGADDNSFLNHDTDSCAGALPDGVLAHCSPIDCSVILQDCLGEGEACRPWANDGGSYWNSTRCVPVDPDPGQAGDPCTVTGSSTSGVDSCDIGLMCWEVDPDTLEGTCTEFCGGTPAEPECAEPDDICLITNDGVLALCLLECDPLVADCDADEVCRPTYDDTFVCVGDQYVACPSGTLEVAPDVVDGCTDAEPCCASYCDLQAEFACERGLECTPFFEEPNPEHPDLGVCASSRSG